MSIKTVNQDELATVLEQSTKPVMVDFYADWCGPCKMLSPIIQEVAQENAEIGEFYKVNVDENNDIAASLNIMSIPTVVVFKNNKVVAKEVGLKAKDFYAELIKNI